MVSMSVEIVQLQLLLWEVFITGVSASKISVSAFFCESLLCPEAKKVPGDPLKPVEQNMTLDLAGFDLMARRNSVKFMTGAPIHKHLRGCWVLVPGLFIKPTSIRCSDSTVM